MKTLSGIDLVRQGSYALPDFDIAEPLVALSLEEFQAISQEGLHYGVHETPFGNAVCAVFQNRLCGFIFQGNVRSQYLVEQAQSHLKVPLLYYHPEMTQPFVDKIFADEAPLTLMGGTPFQIEVWKYLRNIPKGQVMTYQELAQALGRPQAMRSVGQALKSNPLAYVFPCHRVVSSSGKMGGYRWGTGLKEKILAYEGYEEALKLSQSSQMFHR